LFGGNEKLGTLMQGVNDAELEDIAEEKND
jgi:hypothetical protein